MLASEKGPNSSWLCFLALAVCVAGSTHVERDARACTGFRTGTQGRFVVGKSYDWNIGSGLVVFNPIGFQKTALNLNLGETSAFWTSTHASITFDQYGCEMPNGGMNDAGLAIELMMLGQTQFPPPDDRPAVNELQFIQYALDNFASVEEMIEGTALIRISPAYAGVHYLACDLTGSCAAFEWLQGELVLSTGEAMPGLALTNSTYADSAEYLGQFDGFGGSQPIPQSISSLDRFVRASALSVKEAEGEVPLAAFSVLESVSQGDFSKWNIVYDLENRSIHFRTLAASSVKSIALGDFEADCLSGRYVLDIDYPVPGDARGAFEPYTLEANKALLEKTVATIPGLPEVAIEVLALYPGTLECVPNSTPVEPEDGGAEGAAEGAQTYDLVETVSWEETKANEVTTEVLPPAAGPEAGDAPPIASRGGCAISPAVPCGPAAAWLPLMLLLLFVLHLRSARVRPRG